MTSPSPVFLQTIIWGNEITTPDETGQGYPASLTTYYCMYLSNNELYIFEICICVDYSNSESNYTRITKETIEDVEDFIENNTSEYFREGYNIYNFPENLYRISNYKEFETIEEGYIKVHNKYNNEYIKIITWTQQSINSEFQESNGCDDEFNIDIDLIFDEVENYNLLHYLQRYYNTIITDHVSDIIKIYL